MGVAISLTIILLWLLHGWSLLEFSSVDFTSPVMYGRILIQAYLSTGLFITAHDAMHGTISRNSRTNALIGRITSFLFAGISFKKLLKNHIAHHKNPGTEFDPDFSPRSQNFFRWFSLFMIRYTTFGQLVVMAILFNFLKLRYDEISLWLFWIIPLFIATVQLFYFGTYLPHRLPHDDIMQPHNARSQQNNHFFAMISCYFFGYHHEHHAVPSAPWWKLYEIKNSFSKNPSSKKLML